MSAMNEDVTPEEELDFEDESYDRDFDPDKLEQYETRLRARQRLIPAIAAGFIAALLGAALWAGFTSITRFQIGIMAVAAGALCGGAVRFSGRGVDQLYGVIGAIFSLLSILTGKFVSICLLISLQSDDSVGTIMQSLFAEPSLLLDGFLDSFHPMDLLFYVAAVFTGYHMAFVRLKEEELEDLYETPDDLITPETLTTADLGPTRKEEIEEAEAVDPSHFSRETI